MRLLGILNIVYFLPFKEVKASYADKFSHPI